jgi:hypothetical protein
VRFPLPAAVGARVTLRGAEFRPGIAVYLHAYRGTRLRYTAPLGHAKGACGTLVARRRLLPVGARPGGWVLFFDTHRTAPRRYLRGAAGEQFTRRVVVKRERGGLVVAARAVS